MSSAQPPPCFAMDGKDDANSVVFRYPCAYAFEKVRCNVHTEGETFADELTHASYEPPRALERPHQALLPLSGVAPHCRGVPEASATWGKRYYLSSTVIISYRLSLLLPRSNPSRTCETGTVGTVSTVGSIFASGIILWRQTCTFMAYPCTYDYEDAGLMVPVS